MKTIAVIQADLDTTPLTTRSRLADPIGGVPVLRRTVDRLGRAELIDGIYVLCPADQQPRCHELLKGSGAAVRGYEAEPPLWSMLVQTARKWALDAWRGGIGGSTHFDEYTDFRLIKPVVEQEDAGAVLVVPPAAAVIDFELADAMIGHLDTVDEKLRQVFTTAPPGVTGLLVDRELVCAMVEANMPVGTVFSYKPETPFRDLMLQPACLPIPQPLRYATGRLVADTDRSFETVRALLEEQTDPDATSIGRWLLLRESTTINHLPREVEIELTTDDPYPHGLARPRGPHIESRGPIDLELVGQVARALSEMDDSLLVLGGFGDPLRHPDFAGVLERIRSAPPNGSRVFGLAVKTNAVDLSDNVIEALIDYEVDVLQVTLDAWTDETYGRIQSPSEPDRGGLSVVLDRLERLSLRRQQRNSVKPVALPDMTKSKDNVHELDDFFDGWLKRDGAASISGFSHYAHQWEDRSVMSMAPAGRTQCRRIQSRCVVLADGRVTMCDQDLNGLHAIGRLTEQSLPSIWASSCFARIRSDHHAGNFEATELCAACDDWHRP